MQINQTTTEAILADLADAAEFGLDTPHVVACICTAIAKMIAGSGALGGSNQSNLMRSAELVGFAPEFYGAGIRVSFYGKQGQRVTERPTP